MAAQLNNNHQNSKPNVLYIDDDLDNLSSFKFQFMDYYNITLAENADDGYKQLKQKDYPIIIADQRMPGITGTQFFEKILPEFPKSKRMILTGFSDFQSIIDAINRGQIYYYLQKPWNEQEVRLVIKNALESVEFEKRNDELIRVLKEANERLEKSKEELQIRIQESLRAEKRFRDLFENNPISIWEEDFSEVKKNLDTLKQNGIMDYEKYFDENPDFLYKCINLIKVVDVNQATLKTHKVSEKSELFNKLLNLFKPKSYNVFKKEFIAILNGELFLETDTSIVTLQGETRYVTINWSVSPGHEKNYTRVLVSIIDITERKIAEEALRESERNYRELINGMNETIWIIDFDGNLIDVNNTALTVLGYSKEELLEIGLYGIDASLKKNEIKKFARSMPADGLQIFETTHKTKNGKVFPVEVYSSLVSYHGKKAILSIARDITERKKAEQELLESEQKYRTLVTQSPDGIFILDLSGKFLSVNQSMCKTLKYTEEEFLSMKIWDIVPKEYLSLHKDRLDVIVKGESINKAAEYEVVGKDGEIHFIEVLSAPYIKNKEIIGFQGIARDITERKKAEKEIAMLADSLRSVNECVSITDMNDNILFVNDSFLKNYGYNENELVGKNISLVRSQKNPIELVTDILPSTIKGGWTGELWNKKKDGTEFLIHLSTKIIKDKNGNVLGLIGVATDITERKRAEKELILAKEKAEESDKLKSEFLAQMSHEIRSPMNSILSFSNLLKEDLGNQLTPELQETLEGIDTSGHRLMRTVDLIINASEMQIGTYEPTFTVFDLMGEVIQKIKHEYLSLIEKKGLELKIISTKQKVNVYGDKYSIYQIVANLIDNAVKYTNEGAITIDIYTTDDKKKVKFIIEDTGIGMSKDFLEILFKPFIQEDRGYSRKFEGNGLGLTLVKSYCDLNDINISVESVKGKGSKFTLLFKTKV